VSDNPETASAPATTGDGAEPADESFPHWFTQFLNDRQNRKPSAHTVEAYRQDFAAIAALMTDGNHARLTVADITKDSMRQAFAAYAVITKLHRSGAAGPPGTCCAPSSAPTSS
jgi:integrase/recombinase XerC